MLDIQSVPAREEFKIEFDHEQGKHKPKLMHVELLKLRRKLGQVGEHGAYDNIEIGDLEFREDKGLLSFAILGVTQEEALVDVKMGDDAYERPALHKLIAQPLAVELTVKPKQEGGYAVPLPSIKHTIMVRCEEMSYSYEMEEPSQSDLPLPASSEQSARVRLLLRYGRNGPPARDLGVLLAFAPACKTPPGVLEPATGATTDDQGRVEFGYTPADLYYWPGGSYKQEIDVFAVTEREIRLDPLKLSLAPKIRLKLRADKINTQIPDVERFGLELLEQELAQDPPHKLTSLKGTLLVRLSDPATNREFELEVAQAKVEVEAYDGSAWVAICVGDKAIKSDNAGQFTLEFPPLIEAYGEVGEPWEVHPQRGKISYVTLTTAADAEFRLYESHVWQSCRFDLLGADLANQVKGYRVPYHRQLAGQDPSRFEEVVAAINLLSVGATGVGPYYELFGAQYKHFLSTWNDLVSSSVAFAWNMNDASEKIMGAGEKVWKWLQEGQAGRRTARVLLKLGGWMRSILVTLVGYLNRIASWLKEAIPKLGGGLIDDMAEFAVRAAASLESVARQQCTAAKAAVLWLFEALKTVLYVVGRVVLMAVSAVLWIAVRGATAVLAEMGRVIGAATGHPQALEVAREALLAALAKGSTIRVTGEKLVDLLEGWFEGKIKEIYNVPPRVVGWLSGSGPVDLVRSGAQQQIGDLHGRAANLGLPRDHKPRIDEYTARYTANLKLQFEGSEARYYTGLVATAGDYIALIAQTAILIISGLVAVGTLGASLAISTAWVSTIDKAWSGIRACLISLPVWMRECALYIGVGCDFYFGNARLMTA